MANKYVFLLLFSVFIASCSQILLKISANKKQKNKLYEYLNFYVITAYFIFFSSTILTVLAYKGVELKYGAIIESAGYVFILILSKLILKEKITRNQLFGITLIIVGIVVFTR
jgi:small multidrug resistance pump